MSLDQELSSSPKSYIKGLVSIIIPTYNRYDLLMHSIGSCLDQTYQSIEIIVIDDCSTDLRYKNGSLENLPKTKVIHLNVNQKIKYNVPSAQGATRQEGIKVSRGEWIAFLDDDDMFLPEKLEIQLNHLHKNNGLFCSTDMFKINHSVISEHVLQFNIIENFHKNIVVPSVLFIEHIKQTNFINNSTVLLHKSIIDKTGPIEPVKFEDWEYWKKAVIHTPCYYIKLSLVYYTVSIENKPDTKHYSLDKDLSS